MENTGVRMTERTITNVTAHINAKIDKTFAEVGSKPVARHERMNDLATTVREAVATFTRGLGAGSSRSPRRSVKIPSRSETTSAQASSATSGRRRRTTDALPARPPLTPRPPHPRPAL